MSSSPVRSASPLSADLAVDARAHLGGHQRQLRAELGVAETQFVGDALDRGRESEAGLDADDQHVERVRERIAQALLPPLDQMVEHEVRQHQADERRQHREEQQRARGHRRQPRQTRQRPRKGSKTSASAVLIA